MSDYQEQLDKQNEILKNAGFSESFSAEGIMGFGGVRFASCRTCGAAIALTPVVEGEVHSLDLHRHWHALWN